MTGTISFAGPLRIPHLLPHDGPTLTVNYSRVENQLSSVYTGLVPSAAEQGGEFSQASYAGKPVTIYDPAVGAPFPGNVIPLNRISAQALSLLQYYPAPNFSGTNGYNYQVPLIANTHIDNLRLGLQRVIKRRNNFSGVFGLQDTRGDNNSQFNFLDLKRSLGSTAPPCTAARSLRDSTGHSLISLAANLPVCFHSFPVARMCPERRGSRATIRPRLTGVRQGCSSIRVPSPGLAIVRHRCFTIRRARFLTSERGATASTTFSVAAITAGSSSIPSRRATHAACSLTVLSGEAYNVEMGLRL